MISMPASKQPKLTAFFSISPLTSSRNISNSNNMMMMRSSTSSSRQKSDKRSLDELEENKEMSLVSIKDLKMSRGISANSQ